MDDRPASRLRRRRAGLAEVNERARGADVRGRLSLAHVRELREAAAHAVPAAFRASWARRWQLSGPDHDGDRRMDRRRLHVPHDSRRWGSTGSSTASSTRRTHARRDASCRPARSRSSQARIAVTVPSILFVLAAWRLGLICLVLSPFALGLGPLLQLHEALHAVVASGARPRPGDRTGRRIPRGRRAGGASHGGCSSRSPLRSPAGRAASTFSMRCRTSSSTARSRCIRCRRRSASGTPSASPGRSMW